MPDVLTLLSSQSFTGEISIPGDKSISHRALILAALAKGISRISHFLKAQDCLNTLKVLNTLGIQSNWDRGDLWIGGLGLNGFQAPQEPLDFGNSGTGLRLMAGILVGQPFDTLLIGDASLSKRPMTRIIEPLSAMGAKITGIMLNNQVVPPLKIIGGQSLKGISYHLSVASAQAKSCILLASRFAKGATQVYEQKMTRDHTERLLKQFKDTGKGELTACELTIPGDISSAAFLMVASILIPGSHLVLKSVGINPTRMGVIHILKLMGADIQVYPHKDNEWEPIADIVVKYSPLTGIIIPESEVVSAIDEFPILFIAAAFAQGETILRGAFELRVKESDRIATMAENLEKLGVVLQQYPDGIKIIGSEGFNYHSNKVINSKGDHRIAMAFCIAACVLKNRHSDFKMTIEQTECINTSFPNFNELLLQLGSHFASI